MSSPLAIGLVGCGRLAEAGYLPALAARPELRLVAVADTDPARRACVAGLAGAEGFPDAEALVGGVGVDGVVVASPAASHLDVAALATAAGVAVLVEKPPATDAAGAAALAALSPPPWVGFNRRFDPGVDAVRRLIPEAGELRLVLELAYRRRSWGAVSVRDDALLDLGPHLADLARYLLGGPVLAVSATAAAPERAELVLTMARARVHVRVATNRPHREVVEVRDLRGRVVARHRTGGLVAGVRGRLAPSPGPSALVAALAGQLGAFAGVLRGEGPGALGTAADGVAAMEVVDAARASAARGGRPVAVAMAARS